MDTNELPPAEASDVNAPEDTGTDIAQPEETGEASAAQPEESGEASEPLLAGKYKSPEELVKAYKELEGKLGQRDETLDLVKDLERTTGMRADQIRQALTQQEQQRMEQTIQDNPGLAAYQEVQSLKSQLALQNEQRELDNFLSSEEGKPYTAFKDKILKLGLNLEKDKSYADIAREYFGEARATGQQDAYRKIETKKMTQATGASQAAPKSKLAPEELDRMSAADLEAILPHADTSQRLY